MEQGAGGGANKRGLVAKKNDKYKHRHKIEERVVVQLQRHRHRKSHSE